MRQLCIHLREIVRQRFPNHANVALSSFLFLRFFCPAIVSPASIGVPAADLSNKVRKSLIQVAKAVQCLANSVHLEVIGKRSENAWPLGVDTLHKYRKQMIKFFDEVCNIGTQSQNLGSKLGSNQWHFFDKAQKAGTEQDARRLDARLIKGVLLENIDVLVNRISVQRSLVLQRLHEASNTEEEDSLSHRILGKMGSGHQKYSHSHSTSSNSTLEKLRALGSGMFSRNDANDNSQRYQSKRPNSMANSPRSNNSISRESLDLEFSILNATPPTVLPERLTLLWVLLTIEQAC